MLSIALPSKSDSLRGRRRDDIRRFVQLASSVFTTEVGVDLSAVLSGEAHLSECVSPTFDAAVDLYPHKSFRGAFRNDIPGWEWNVQRLLSTWSTRNLKRFYTCACAIQRLEDILGLLDRARRFEREDKIQSYLERAAMAIYSMGGIRIDDIPQSLREPHLETVRELLKLKDPFICKVKDFLPMIRDRIKSEIEGCSKGELQHDLILRLIHVASTAEGMCSKLPSATLLKMSNRDIKDFDLCRVYGAEKITALAKALNVTLPFQYSSHAWPKSSGSRQIVTMAILEQLSENTQEFTGTPTQAIRYLYDICEKLSSEQRSSLAKHAGAILSSTPIRQKSMAYELFDRIHNAMRTNEAFIAPSNTRCLSTQDFADSEMPEFTAMTMCDLKELSAATLLTFAAFIFPQCVEVDRHDIPYSNIFPPRILDWRDTLLDIANYTSNSTCTVPQPLHPLIDYHVKLSADRPSAAARQWMLKSENSDIALWKKWPCGPRPSLKSITLRFPMDTIYEHMYIREVQRQGKDVLDVLKKCMNSTPRTFYELNTMLSELLERCSVEGVVPPSKATGSESLDSLRELHYRSTLLSLDVSRLYNPVQPINIDSAFDRWQVGQLWNYRKKIWAEKKSGITTESSPFDALYEEPHVARAEKHNFKPLHYNTTGSSSGSRRGNSLTASLRSFRPKRRYAAMSRN